MSAGMVARPLVLPLGLGLAAAVLAALQFHAAFPGNPDALHEAVLVHAALPRLAMAALAGAGLAFSGALMQAVLRNPLAEPTTLGVSAGSALALALAAIYAPALLEGGRDGVALGGAVLACLLVFGLGWRHRLAPLPLILAGLVVSLYCGTLANLAALFHRDFLQSLFVWNTGSLVQTDWGPVLGLLPRLVVLVAAGVFLQRPLSTLALDDESARSLGVPLRALRFAALGIAVLIGALVTSAVGLIGFIGLAGPALARMGGARSLRQILLTAPLVGGALLVATDQAVLLLAPQQAIPVGTVTAFFGAPLMLWLLPRLRAAEPPRESAGQVRRLERPLILLVVLAAALLVAGCVALALGHGPAGWHLAGGQVLSELLPWRWPRSLAVAAAGAMLAAAGTLLQRLTGNPLAAPEVLGISAGAALGVVALVFLVSAPSRGLDMLAATAGAAVTLGIMLTLGRRADFAPERVLLAGVALNTLFSGLFALLMASGDPRIFTLQAWMAGSTYGVGPQEALVLAALAVVLVLPAMLTHRWLAILPLGEAPGRALGLDLSRSRLVLLLFVAALTALPTLVVGPLSFVGLMAPHIARSLGLQRPLAHYAGAVLLGALILVLADWLGRTLLFPYQVPAGLLATFVGAPFFLLLLRRG